MKAIISIKTNNQRVGVACIENATSLGDAKDIFRKHRHLSDIQMASYYFADWEDIENSSTYSRRKDFITIPTLSMDQLLDVPLDVFIRNANSLIKSLKESIKEAIKKHKNSVPEKIIITECICTNMGILRPEDWEGQEFLLRRYFGLYFKIELFDRLGEPVVFNSLKIFVYDLYKDYDLETDERVK